MKLQNADWGAALALGAVLNRTTPDVATTAAAAAPARTSRLLRIFLSLG